MSAKTSGIARCHGSWGEWSQSLPSTKIIYFQKITSIVKFLLVWLNNLQYVECRKSNFVIAVFILLPLKLLTLLPRVATLLASPPPPKDTHLQIKKLCSMLFAKTFHYFAHLRPSYFPQHPILGTPKACFLHNDRDWVSHPYQTVDKIIVFMLIFIFLHGKFEDKRFWVEWWQEFCELNLLIIPSWMLFSSICITPKYLNFATFSEDLTPMYVLQCCPVLYTKHVYHLVFSDLTIFLVPTHLINLTTCSFMSIPNSMGILHKPASSVNHSLSWSLQISHVLSHFIPIYFKVIWQIWNMTYSWSVVLKSMLMLHNNFFTYGVNLCRRMLYGLCSPLVWLQ